MARATVASLHIASWNCKKEMHVLSTPILILAVMLVCTSFAVAVSPLEQAITSDDLSAVEKLAGADPQQLKKADDAGLSPLHLAAKANAKKSAEWLLANGADFYARDNNGQLPLDVPPGQQLNDVRKRLREFNKGRNEFLGAVGKGDVENARQLLAADKSLAGARDIGDGWSPVMMACHFGNVSMLEALIAGGCLLDATDFNNGQDAVIVCANKGQADCLKLLLKAKVDPKRTARINYGSLQMEMNALHMAAWKKKPAVVALLIGAGVDVNARAKSYAVFSPLHFAATEGDAESVDLLLKAGADREARDGRRNITALEMAQAGKHQGCAERLAAP